MAPLHSLKDKSLFHCQPAVTVVTLSGHMTLIFCLPNTLNELCWSCGCLIPSVVPFLDDACSYQVSTELEVFGELDIKLDCGSKYSTIYHTASKFVTEGFEAYKTVRAHTASASTLHQKYPLLGGRVWGGKKQANNKNKATEKKHLTKLHEAKSFIFYFLFF